MFTIDDTPGGYRFSIVIQLQLVLYTDPFLKNWINFNEKKFLKEKFKLKNIKTLLVKLKLKVALNYFKSILK